jgi:ankyrin repeat protein
MLETVRFLISKGANINILDEADWTPLMRAAANRNIEMADLLISAGAEINARNPYGWTALFTAVSYGSAGTVKHLMQKGANPNIKDEKGMTPLMYAAAGEDEFEEDFERTRDIIKYLAAHGADINALNKDGKTAAELASGKKTKQLLNNQK